MATVVSASDIVPSLYEDEGSDSNSEEGEFHEDQVDDLTYDTHNLVACDYHQVVLDGDDVANEAKIQEAATRATQLLVNSIFSLPIESSDVGPVAVLPSKEGFRYPREKRVPEPKGLTVWEKFAKQKGIKNKKRDRMVYDDQEDEYKPRFGYKGVNNGEEEHAIIEVKHGADSYADPWEAARLEKKERVSKNEKQRLRNIERMEGGRGGKGKASGKEKMAFSKSVSYDAEKTAGIPLDMVKKGGKRGKEGVRQALQLAQHSTASMGRYDDKRYGEPEKKIKGLKRKFSDNVGSATLSSEKKLMKSQLRIVADKTDKKARGVTNSLAAYEGILPDAPGDRFRAKKGKQSGSDTGKSKKTATGQKKTKTK